MKISLLVALAIGGGGADRLWLQDGKYQNL